MSDSQLLLFGSFTEDETRSLLRQPSGSAENPAAKKGLQFGSVNFVTDRTLATLGTKLLSKADSSKAPIDLCSSNLLKKDNETNTVDGKNALSSKVPTDLCTSNYLKKDDETNSVDGKNALSSKAPTDLCSSNYLKKDDETNSVDRKNALSSKAPTDLCSSNYLKGDETKSVDGTNKLSSEVVGTPKENGGIHNFTHHSSFSNGVVNVNEQNPACCNFNSVCISPNEEHLNQVQSLELHVAEKQGSKERDLNGTINDSLPFVPLKKEILKASNEPAPTVKNLLPRGLINSGNLCFLNATLQALLSCTPFIQLLQELRIRSIPKVGYPTLTAFVEFVSDFDMPADLSLKKKDVNTVETGRPFIPVMFEDVLKKFTPDVPNKISGRPRQEDAQEFLSFVMDQMHDELLKLEGFFSNLNGEKSSLVSTGEDDEWETVGPKNKSAVTRTQNFAPSQLSAIFGGQWRSVVKARGNKASATVQPFLLLHLDILPDAIHTIEDALRLFSAPETLEGYRTSGTGKAGLVTASKSVKIQKLSKIMILHLMRFYYDENQGSTKLHKPVSFPLELVLGRELLVSPSTEGRKYELVATITHHGKDPSRGHYTTDACRHSGQWLRFDDSSVTCISTSKVLHEQPYVLFYKQV